MEDTLEKVPGDFVRYIPSGSDQIENDWRLIRFEPSSGNAVIERDAKRININRNTFYVLNFPGSDDVYRSLTAAQTRDPEAGEALKLWTSGDLKATRKTLINIICRSAPMLVGIQNSSDLSRKLIEKEETVTRATDILKLDVSRAEREYNNYLARTSFENDEKDNLLLRLRDFEDRYATKLFEKNNLIPLWQGYFRALAALEAKIRS